MTTAGEEVYRAQAVGEAEAVSVGSEQARGLVSHLSAQSFECCFSSPRACPSGGRAEIFGEGVLAVQC